MVFGTMLFQNPLSGIICTTYYEPCSFRRDLVLTVTVAMGSYCLGKLISFDMFFFFFF